MKNKEQNPMFTKKGAWLWLVCAPAALLISAHYDSKKDMEKWRKKRKAKEEEFNKLKDEMNQINSYLDSYGIPRQKGDKLLSVLERLSIHMEKVA